jgi:hypothetical protein
MTTLLYIMAVINPGNAEDITKLHAASSKGPLQFYSAISHPTETRKPLKPNLASEEEAYQNT